jgi:hypothetical protein
MNVQNRVLPKWSWKKEKYVIIHFWKKWSKILITFSKSYWKKWSKILITFSKSYWKKWSKILITFSKSYWKKWSKNNNFPKGLKELWTDQIEKYMYSV